MAVLVVLIGIQFPLHALAGILDDVRKPYSLSGVNNLLVFVQPDHPHVYIVLIPCRTTRKEKLLCLRKILLPRSEDHNADLSLLLRVEREN